MIRNTLKKDEICLILIIIIITVSNLGTKLSI